MTTALAEPAAERRQELPRVHEVASVQKRRPAAKLAKRLVRGRPVIRWLKRPGRRQARVAPPVGLLPIHHVANVAGTFAPVRSHSGPDLKGRCKVCWVMQTHCLCDVVPKVSNRTHVHILRHHHEATKPTNTARIAALALQRVQITEWRTRTPPDVEALFRDQGRAWVLFPSGTSADPTEERPDTLVVLDGTWKQTRKMMHHHPPLLRLPRWGLSQRAPAILRLRASKDPNARSTLEAIAEALGELEGPHIREPLLQLHDVMVERILRARGMFPKERITDPAA